MKRISLIVIAGFALLMITAIYTLPGVGHTYGQTRQTNSNTQVAAPRGKALVKRLPRNVEGVELRESTIRLRPGYEFVNQNNGTILVALKNNAGGVKGTWKCVCSPAGTATGGCDAHISNETLTCYHSGCSGSCKLAVTVDGVTKMLVKY